MHRFQAFLVVLLVFSVGCKKKTDSKASTPTTGKAAPAAGGSGVAMNPSGGGSGGAAQAIRKAVGRAVNQNELRNIHLFVESASSASGAMPTVPEILNALRLESPATLKLVEDGAIVLTGARQRASIWAYTADAQSVTGEHLVVNQNGVERMQPDALRAALGNR
ncbi:MAG: hypothetical protein ACKO23_11605 [Gemmataceae bacterium]